MRKLEPRYIGPFEILERVGTVAYQLALLPSLSGVPHLYDPEVYSRSILYSGLGRDCC